MTIYLDYIFIENLLIDYILLKETSYISKKKITNKRTIFSAIIASVYVVVMTYLKLQEFNYLISKIFLVVVIIYISFKPSSINEYVKIVVLFFLISVINVGTLTVITSLLNLQSIFGILKIVIYVLSMLLSRFFTSQMWKIYKQNIKGEDLIYTVKIKLNEKTYEYRAFLDTGNNVFSYSYNVPIIFAEILDDDILENLNEKESFAITTCTLSSQAQKKAYILNNVEISKKGKTWIVKTAVVFEKIRLAKDSSYNMLLNYNLYVQDMGGIKI